ncbi:MAG: hypothetical protein WCC94_03070 [Candidatus Bathyarchaeia archaeon]
MNLPTSVAESVKLETVVHNVVGEPRCPHCLVWSPKDADYCANCGLKFAPAPVRDAAWFAAVRTNTRHFYDSLHLPPLSLLMQVPEGDDEIATDQRILLCVGEAASGKTAKTNRIIRYLVQVYGAENVAVLSANGEEFRQIMAGPWPHCLVIVIRMEDATEVKFTHEEIRDFFRSRHIMHERTGQRNGLVVLMFTVHNLYDVQKELRTKVPLLLLSDVPTNTWDLRDTRTYLIPDKKDEECLRQLSLERLVDRDLRRYCYFIESGRPVGIVDLPRVPPAPPPQRKPTHRIFRLFHGKPHTETRSQPPATLTTLTPVRPPLRPVENPARSSGEQETQRKKWHYGLLALFLIGVAAFVLRLLLPVLIP